MSVADRATVDVAGLESPLPAVVSVSQRAGGDAQLQETLSRRDPRRDGWDTEVIHDLAESQLTRLGELIAKGSIAEAAMLEPLIDPGLDCDRLRPDSMATVYATGELTIRRWSREDEDHNAVQERPTSLGARRFADCLSAWARLWDTAPGARVKFKVTSVRVPDPAAEIAELEVHVLIAAESRQGVVQVNAAWQTAWRRGAEEDAPRLRSIRLFEYEEIVGTAAEGTLFADVTQAVLGGNRSFREQLMRSTNDWQLRLQASLGIDLFGHQGLSVGDVNGDGLDDVYVCQPGGVPNRLYVQNPDGTARDVSREAAVDLLDRSRSALILDFDNDGDQDLSLVTDATLVFLENLGGTRFRVTASEHVGTATSHCAADYDGDGDLDVYVCGYSAPTGGDNAPLPYHDANNGYRNVLMRNDGNWRFTDATEEVGLDENNRRFTLAASWEDFDNDGDQDLYVANDFGRNNLYRNDGGRFRDIAAQAGVEDISAGMGVAWGDFNSDGVMDIYVSNMFSSAGHRVAYQRTFRAGDDEATRGHFQRHARGNTLFLNAGDGTFRDVSLEAGVTMGRWAWGSLFADINNDGHEDILITNGLVTGEDTGDL